MSKIVFKLSNDFQNLNDYLVALKKATGFGLSEIKGRVTSNRPIAEFILFENDHDEVAGKVERIISIFDGNLDDLQIYELELDEDFDTADLELSQTSVEVLNNMLAEFRIEREIQEEFSVREAGE